MDLKIVKMIADKIGMANDCDNRIFLDDERVNVNAALMGKKVYNKMEKDLQKTEIKRKGYTVYAWNDISGFEYWSKDSDDFNYIQITATITDLNKVDVEQLKADMYELNEHFMQYDNMEKYYSKRA